MHREAEVEISVPSVSEKNWIDNTSHTLHTISSFFTISACFFLYYLLPSKTSLLLAFLYGLHFQSLFTLIFSLIGTFYVPRHPFSSSGPLLRAWSYRFATQQSSLEHNQWGKKKPKQKPKHIRCTLFTNRHIFSTCSESFLLIDHLHSNPWWSSEFLQCSWLHN